MKYKVRNFIILVTLLLPGLSGHSWAQDLWLLPPVRAEGETKARFAEAKGLVDRHRFDEAKTILLEIADQNPGTSIGAEALWSAIGVLTLGQQHSEAETVRLSLIAQYPLTRYEINARLIPVSDEISGASAEAKVTAYGEFGEQFGAPPLSGIIGGQGIDSAVMEIKQLHPEIRWALRRVYTNAFYTLLNNGRDEEALNLARFGRRAFDCHPRSDNAFQYDLGRALERITGSSSVGRQPSNPTIEILTPQNGETVGPAAEVSVRVVTGDYRFTAADLTTLEFEIDGIDHSLSVYVESELDTSLTPGTNFETLTLSVAPGLSPGLHAAQVKIRAMPTPDDPPEGPGTAVIAWSFTVVDQPTEMRAPTPCSPSRRSPAKPR